MELETSIEFHERAVKQSSWKSYEHSIILGNLGKAIKYRYMLKGRIEDLYQGIEIFKEAAETGLFFSATAGLSNARSWMNWAFERKSWA